MIIEDLERYCESKVVCEANRCAAFGRTVPRTLPTELVSEKEFDEIVTCTYCQPYRAKDAAGGIIRAVDFHGVTFWTVDYMKGVS